MATIKQKAITRLKAQVDYCSSLDFFDASFFLNEDIKEEVINQRIRNAVWTLDESIRYARYIYPSCAKRKIIKRAETLLLQLAESLDYCYYADDEDCHYDTNALREAYCERLVLPVDYYKALGKKWTMIDNICANLNWIYPSLQNKGTINEMMTADEQAALADLPEKIKIWRGQDSEEDMGICWSLDRSVAINFARNYTNRHHRKSPTLLSAEIDKQDVVALMLDRDEQEIISFNVNVISETSI